MITIDQRYSEDIRFLREGDAEREMLVLRESSATVKIKLPSLVADEFTPMIEADFERGDSTPFLKFQGDAYNAIDATVQDIEFLLSEAQNSLEELQGEPDTGALRSSLRSFMHSILKKRAKLEGLSEIPNDWYSRYQLTPRGVNNLAAARAEVRPRIFHPGGEKVELPDEMSCGPFAAQAFGFCYTPKNKLGHQSVYYGTDVNDLISAMKAAGYKLTKISGATGVTVKNFIAQHPEGGYLISVYRHLLAVKDGVVWDRAGQGPTSLRKIQQVWEVT